jgi:hypothetical protein
MNVQGAERLQDPGEDVRWLMTQRTSMLVTPRTAFPGAPFLNSGRTHSLNWRGTLCNYSAVNQRRFRDFKIQVPRDSRRRSRLAIEASRIALADPFAYCTFNAVLYARMASSDGVVACSSGLSRSFTVASDSPARLLNLLAISAQRVQQIFFPGDLHLLFVNPGDSVISLRLLRTFGFSSVVAERIGDQRSSDESGTSGLRSPGATGVSFDPC